MPNAQEGAARHAGAPLPPPPHHQPAAAAASHKHGEHPALPSLARSACLQPFTPPAGPPSRECLFLSDFDKTLVDFDAGERLIEEVAPELLPMLVQGVADPADSWIPLTNSLLAEAHRRGVGGAALLAALRRLGAAELPPETAALLRALRARGVDARVLSDANSVFVAHILAGARCAGLVQGVVTNPAAFERVAGGGGGGLAPLGAAPESPGGGGGGASNVRRGVLASFGGGKAAAAAAPGRANGGAEADEVCVVRPWHSGEPHGCSSCPPNLCKGLEVRAIRASGVYRRVVYAGDGGDDVCAALCLGAGDVVLARAGHPLARYLARARAGEPGTLPVRAQWRVWSTHRELHDLALAFAGGGSGGGEGGGGAEGEALGKSQAV